MSSDRTHPRRSLDTLSSTGTQAAGDPATRQRICEAALRLITKGRGADVTMASVARAAGVSRQALYLHFADRSALMLAAVHYADEQRGVPAAVQRITSAASGEEALAAMVDMQAQLNPGILPLARVLEAERRDDADAERSWRDRLMNRLHGCRTIVAALQRDGRLRPDLNPDVAADLLWTLTSLRTWEDLTQVRKWSAEDYQVRLKDAVARLILAPPATGRRKR